MHLLCKRLTKSIANIGEYIESEHIRYWKKFHRFNANRLNLLTSN